MKLWMYRLRIYNRRGECAGQSVGLIQAETEEKARAALAEDMGDNACIANIWEPTISDNAQRNVTFPLTFIFNQNYTKKTNKVYNQ